jgi:uncharacterized membrane protein
MFDNIVNFLHLIATSVWIGGAFYAHFILLPAVKQIDPQQGGKLQGIIAKRFSIAAWTSIIILLITGFIKTPDGLLFDTSTDLGMTLFIKHLLIGGVIIIGLSIGLYVVPNMRKNSPKPGEAPSDAFKSYQKRLGVLASVNLFLGLAVVFCASFLW